MGGRADLAWQAAALATSRSQNSQSKHMSRILLVIMANVRNFVKIFMAHFYTLTQEEVHICSHALRMFYFLYVFEDSASDLEQDRRILYFNFF